MTRKNSLSPDGLRKVSVRLAWVPDMAEVGIFVAQEKGFYKAEGLDMEIKPGGFGLDPFKMVASGADTFGVGGAGNLLLAREQGVPAIAIAAEFQRTPVGFVTKASSGITSVKQFRGKRIGVQTGADTDVLYRALLSYNNMTSNDVIEVPIQYDAKPFLTGQIDVLPAYVTNQPITLANQGVKTNIITAASEGVNMYGNIYFVADSTFNEDPELVHQFLRATKKGWEYVFANKEDAIAVVSKHVDGFSQSDLDKIYDSVIPYIKPADGVPLLGMIETHWLSTYDVLKRAGMTNKTIDINTAYRVVE